MNLLTFAQEMYQATDGAANAAAGAVRATGTMPAPPRAMEPR